MDDTAAVEASLMQLSGVGRKVADCIALFSLNQSGAIPVDTHVWEIVTRDYAQHLAAAKSLTPKVHDEIGAVFRALFGSRAGWAHSVLFASELPEFRQYLPSDLQQDMKEFSDDRRKEKKRKKALKSPQSAASEE